MSVLSQRLGEQLCEQLIALLPRLRRLARVILETDPATDASRQHADDLVQTCIEQTLCREASWHDQRGLENELFGRLTRACAAHGEPAPIEESTRHEDLARATLRSCYAALPLPQRAAIALVVLEQRSYRDAAAMLEMPLPALTQQLWQGRETLQAQLQAG